VKHKAPLDFGRFTKQLTNTIAIVPIEIARLRHLIDIFSNVVCKTGRWPIMVFRSECADSKRHADDKGECHVHISVASAGGVHSCATYPGIAWEFLRRDDNSRLRFPSQERVATI
jgi:hypothetical protein